MVNPNVMSRFAVRRKGDCCRSLCLCRSPTKKRVGQALETLTGLVYRKLGRSDRIERPSDRMFCVAILPGVVAPQQLES